MPSIKKNFFYSSILTCANYVFPFLTFPYVSRVLGVTNIGICNFVDSIVNYFILFSMLGISTVGIREVAGVRGDKEKLSQVFSNLFILNTISTTIVLAVLIVCIFTIPEFYEYKNLFFISCLKLVGNYLLIEWLYKGLENFRYITIRSIIVKCCYVVGVFVFVKKPTDYPIYYFLMSLMWTLNAVFNISYARKFVSLKYRGFNVRPYVKSFIILGGYSLLISMYSSFNVACLGFVAGVTEVGYYTTATKIYHVIIALYTAFTGVMLPRMSSLVKENRMEEFKTLLDKSVDALLAFSIPMAIVFIAFAPQVIRVIAGAGYGGAILPMRIVMPHLFIIGYSQIMIIQVLMPLKKDKNVTTTVACGAVVGVILNILLIHTYKSVGSAFVWLGSEVTVMLTAQYLVRQCTCIRFPVRKVAKNIAFSLPAFGIAVVFYYLHLQVLMQLILGGICVLLYCYAVQIFVIKNAVVIDALQKLQLRLKTLALTKTERKNK